MYYVVVKTCKPGRTCTPWPDDSDGQTHSTTKTTWPLCQTGICQRSKKINLEKYYHDTRTLHLGHTIYTIPARIKTSGIQETRLKLNVGKHPLTLLGLMLSTCFHWSPTEHKEYSYISSFLPLGQNVWLHCLLVDPVDRGRNMRKRKLNKDQTPAQLHLCLGGPEIPKLQFINNSLPC